MRQYKILNYDDRRQIERLYAQGDRIEDISFFCARARPVYERNSPVDEPANWMLISALSIAPKSGSVQPWPTCAAGGGGARRRVQKYETLPLEHQDLCPERNRSPSIRHRLYFSPLRSRNFRLRTSRHFKRRRAVNAEQRNGVITTRKEAIYKCYTSKNSARSTVSMQARS